MQGEERIKQQKELVELMGRIYDKKGLQPIPGRIIGLLTVMDKEQYSFEEIIEELQISKGSASLALRMLETADIIDYVTFPGDRKRYFQIKRRDAFSIIEEHINKMTETRDILSKALALKADKKSVNALFMKNMIDMLSFFLDKFEELKEQYTGNNKDTIQ